MNSFSASFSLENCRTILTKILDANNFIVKSCEFCPLDEQKGFLGEHAYLKIIYEHDGESKTAKLFVKAVPKNSSSCSTYIMEGGLFLKEATFYQELIPKMLENGVRIIEECVPICYFTSKNEYLIFEDLLQKGYRNENHQTSLSIHAIKEGLCTLAKLHSSGFIFEEKLRMKSGKDCRMDKLYPAMFKESYFSYTQSSIKRTEAMKLTAATQIELALNDRSIDAGLLRKATCEYIDKIRELIKPSDMYRNTVCHSDIWVANFMFKYEEGKPTSSRIIDFQTYRYAPPAQDFMTYMYLVADQSVRVGHMRDMMRWYYEKMCDVLEEYGLGTEKLLSYEEFEDSCKFYKILAAILALNHNVLVWIPPRLMKRLFKGEMDMGNFICEDRSVIIKECWRECQQYRNKIRETVEDLVESFREVNLL